MFQAGGGGKRTYTKAETKEETAASEDTQKVTETDSKDLDYSGIKIGVISNTVKEDGGWTQSHWESFKKGHGRAEFIG